MGVIGGMLGYQLLRWIKSDGGTNSCQGGAYQGRSKLEVLLGKNIWEFLAGKIVIDFGCGDGAEAIEIAQHAASKVIGIDIREHKLDAARCAAREAGVADRCLFVTEVSEKADVVISIDAFEHFSDPARILSLMRQVMKDNGCIIIAFGPPWKHPLGGHLFSVFPWAHLVFTEKALIRWRQEFKHDGATRFHEVEGGLNQMTVRKFERLVEESDFRFETFETVSIRPLQWAATSFTREYTTSVVRTRLVEK